jgi:hypothetical protein
MDVRCTTIMSIIHCQCIWRKSIQQHVSTPPTEQSKYRHKNTSYHLRDHPMLHYDQTDQHVTKFNKKHGYKKEHVVYGSSSKKRGEQKGAHKKNTFYMIFFKYP